MTQRRRALVLLAGIGIVGASSSQASSQGAPERTLQDRDAWVAEALKRIMTVTPGMTRG